MKKVLFILFNLLTVTAMAQTKGRFEVHDLGNCKLHVYYTNDALGDASYIIEGKDALVAMEQPLFKDNVAEFDTYLSNLKKPVEKRITDYHVGGTGNHDVVMAEGMPEFTKGEVYGGMMQGFAQAFGDALTDMPTGKASEVAFGTTQTWAGITFEFRPGASSDFPGASILIGGKAYYTHWTPAKAHASHLQISSPAAIDAEIAEAENSLASGAELFIGGHGGAARRDAVEFKIAYLKKMKELLAKNGTVQDFVDGMKKAYPGLPGEAGLADLGKALYK
ncbi:MAG: hypothetical protein IAB08_03475 [Bacteroidetes bacterium]|uniref:Metallo-beta-lactamase domain-containing protein n=1 Tax=Candidatus Pullibacteroides excrementavium TaxID=2840905 RepID=A0A9D9DUH2_9BACT|nr:hypothetical protein [Candidatus Pullibacteroides excrementavium]